MEKADQVADITYGGKNKTNCSEKTVTVLSIYIYIYNCGCLSPVTAFSVTQGITIHCLYVVILTLIY